MLWWKVNPPRPWVGSSAARKQVTCPSARHFRRVGGAHFQPALLGNGVHGEAALPERKLEAQAAAFGDGQGRERNARLQDAREGAFHLMGAAGQFRFGNGDRALGERDRRSEERSVGEE